MLQSTASFKENMGSNCNRSNTFFLSDLYQLAAETELSQEEALPECWN